MTLLDEVVSQMRARVDELRPVVEEHAELVEALSKLNGAGLMESVAVVKSGSGKSETRLPIVVKQVNGRKRGRRSGETQERIYGIVKANPGIGGRDINRKLGRDPGHTAVYGALKRLSRDGRVTSQAGGWSAR